MSLDTIATRGYWNSLLAIATRGYFGAIPYEIVAQLLLDSWTASITPWVGVTSTELWLSCNHVEPISHVSDVVLVGSTVRFSLEVLVEELEEEP